MTEDTGIFCIKAEYKTDAKDIQTFQSTFTIRLCILFVKSIVKQANHFASSNRNFHFPLQMLIFAIYQKDSR